mmetsp:Transcript_97873/g.279929  ORF Transcript_97873/g.279929 Transcript_97873/m.279929 type:complete len:117 (-) Transcript_97873:105-455(-)
MLSSGRVVMALALLGARSSGAFVHTLDVPHNSDAPHTISTGDDAAYTLTLVDDEMGKCLDGTSPAYYIRGSQIKLMVLPEFLKNSPAFKKVASAKAKNDAKNATKKPFKGKKKASA